MQPGFWSRLTDNPLADFRIFKLKEDLWASPNRDYKQNFISIEAPDWVNVVALTQDHQFICVKQWRAGTNTIELEVPGGMIDTRDSSPISAGVRELLEETGYRGEKATIIGKIFPNPAIQNNICHTVFVSGCRKVSETRFDPGEEIVTELIPEKDLEQRLKEGAFQHALVAVAFQHYLLNKGCVSFNPEK